MRRGFRLGQKKTKERERNESKQTEGKLEMGWTKTENMESRTKVENSTRRW